MYHRIRCKYPHNTKSPLPASTGKGRHKRGTTFVRSPDTRSASCCLLATSCKVLSCNGDKTWELTVKTAAPVRDGLPQMRHTSGRHRCSGFPGSKATFHNLPLGSLPASGFLYNTCLPCILHREAQMPTSITQTAALSGKGSCVLLFVIAFILS